MHNEPRVSVIILNFNGKRFLKECLDSVLNQTYRNYQIILVDNGSTDGSVEFIEKNYSEVKLIRNDKNFGFAEGNNIGIRRALEDATVEYVALLNNDVKVDRNWLAELIAVAEKEGVDMVGSKILFYDKPLINSVGIMIRKEGEAEDIGFGMVDTYSKVMEIFGPCAGAALYSRKLLEDINIDDDYFDSDFFAYFEDVDLAFRARLLGYRCLFNPKAIIYHHWAGTAGKRSKFSIYYGKRNRHYLLIKDYPLQILIKHFLRIILIEIAIIGHAVMEGEFIITLKGKLDAIRNLKKMLLKRKEIQAKKKVSDTEIDRWLAPYPFMKKFREKLFSKKISI